MSSGTITTRGDFGGLNVYHAPYEGEDYGGTGTPSTVGCINFYGGTMNAIANRYAFACDGNLNITGTTAEVTADAMYGML